MITSRENFHYSFNDWVLNTATSFQIKFIALFNTCKSKSKLRIMMQRAKEMELKSLDIIRLVKSVQRHNELFRLMLNKQQQIFLRLNKKFTVGYNSEEN